MLIKTVKDVSVKGKKVFARVDFNVPLNENGEIIADVKIKAALPTIRYLLAEGASVILASHLGRPKGKIDEKLRLTPVAERLRELCGAEVIKADEVVGPQVEQLAANLQPGQILLLENVRFHPGEKANDPQLAKAYAQLAELFVSDAFGTAHRAHASNVGVAAFLPAVAGFLMEKEITALSRSLHNPQKPVVAIVGGSKITDKINVLNNFLTFADAILLGGGMANTFLRAKGYKMGKSLLEPDQVGQAKEIMEKAQVCGVNLCLPVDLTVATDLHDEKGAENVPAGAVPQDKMALDIGEKTRAVFAEQIKAAKTIVWNGPLGVFEVSAFAQGTIAVAKAVAAGDAFSIIGGGDVVAAVEQAGVSEQISHLSTGGGATLEFWEGKELPGIAVLQDKQGGKYANTIDCG
ncbi:MAG: phosphoglycerate kinase [Firmicutes bacterium]|nr:phosphoglycerate kinase [Bacillota bacterium]